MNAAGIAAVITAVTSLVAAITALVRTVRHENGPGHGGKQQ